MFTKSNFKLAVKIIGLVVAYLIIFIVNAGITDPAAADSNASPEAAASTLVLLLILAVVEILVLSLVIRRSNASGLALIAFTAFSYYGVKTFQSQIEAWYFAEPLGIPTDMFPGVFFSPIPFTLMIVALAVLVLGKGKKSHTDQTQNERLKMSPRSWAGKLSLIAVVYIVLYFVFGYVIAWQNPELVNTYDSATNQAVFNITRMIPFQFMRGILWGLLALPILKYNKGSRLETALVLGLMLSLPLSIGLIFPNPFFPDASVRMSHFVEITSSNFIFGLLITRIMLGKLTYRPIQETRTDAVVGSLSYE